jgi:hypothetical protein
METLVPLNVTVTVTSRGELAVTDVDVAVLGVHVGVKLDQFQYQTCVIWAV